MKNVALAFLIIATFGFPGFLAGQFSSDIPGVPRASVPFYGGNQGRTEMDFLYFQNSSQPQEKWVGQARLGYGRSIRIGSKMEFGFAFSFANAVFTQLDEETPESEGFADTYNATNTLQGAFLYGLRFGLKYQPISFVSPEGHGVTAAIGASYQPSLSPGFTVERAGDSLWTGYPGSEAEYGGATPFRTSLNTSQDQLIQIAGMASYRSRRIIADGSLVSTSRSEGDGFPISRFSGMSVRLGGMFRLTPGFALGGAYWSSGASPWQDQIRSPSLDDGDPSYAFVVGFGQRPEVGTDMIVMSPSGSFSESVRVYFRFRTSY